MFYKQNRAILQVVLFTVTCKQGLVSEYAVN